MQEEESKKRMMSGFSLVNEDVMQNIFSRLPALSFASAACVSKCWNRVCTLVLPKPKIASALSLNPSLHDAVNEVVDKVLSKPIRPHFAIACIGKQFSLEVTHQAISEKLGSRIPVITNAASGIIGIDALTNELREVNWELLDEDDRDPNSQEQNTLDRGIVLAIGFVPGIKLGTIPLLRPTRAPQVSLVDKFLTDIRTFTASVSDCTSPAAIILFGGQNIDMKPVLAKIDCSMPEETAIVGDASGCFLCRGGDNFLYSHLRMDMYFFDAVALVFAKDRDESHGEIQFQVAMSTGVMPFGPQLKAVGVIAQDSEHSWLTARMEGQPDILDGEGLLGDINDQFGDEESRDIFIGVVQQRECSTGLENLRSGASLAFYEVLRGYKEYFVVNGVGIKPGDSFLFYHSDTDTASSSCGHVYKRLEILKAESDSKNSLQLRNAGGDNATNREVFGGFIFSCNQRGESFFGYPNVDSFPFWKNFPGVPLAGLFCGSEIGRVSTSSMREEDNEGNSARCCLHVYSTVYLVMSYLPAPCLTS